MLTDIDLDFFGASARGPLHIKNKEPNQDSWLGVRRRYGALIVVCDGLGSRSEAEKGSKMACYAVRDAVNYWIRHCIESNELLIRLIHLMWSMRVSPSPIEDCATTCLFGLIRNDGTGLVAGLGDGAALIKHPQEKIIKVVWGRSGFTNETKALGYTRQLGDWHIYPVTGFKPKSTILLASDGISDDLVEERLEDFMEHLIDEYGSLSPRLRTRTLAKELINWPTPSHSDDKTIAMLYGYMPRTEENANE